MLSNLGGVYEIVQCEGWFLPKVKADILRAHIHLFLIHYRAVALESLQRGVLNWPIVTKFHALWHIGEAGQFINPRLAWTYQCENVVQKMIRIGKATVSGLGPVLQAQAIMLKYRWVLYIRLKRRVA